MVKLKANTFLKGVICVAGIYIGWFIFLVQTFNSIADKHSDTNILFGRTFGNHNSFQPLSSANAITDQKDHGINSVDDEGAIIQNELHGNFYRGREQPGVDGLDHVTQEEQNQNPGDDEVTDDKQRESICPGSSGVCVFLNNFNFDKTKAEQAIQAYGRETKQRIKPLTAYLERKMDDVIPNTGRIPDYSDRKDDGEPDLYKEPLPLRTKDAAAPDKLHKVKYPKVDSCHDLAAKFPTDAGLLLNDEGDDFRYKNSANRETDPDVMEYAKYCPVDADPYLPWIHDIFPSNDGKVVHFIAQNKRRCNTGRRFKNRLEALLPQVALMQPVSVERIDNEEANTLAPELWSPESGDDDELGLPRYRLSSTDEAKEGDGDFTRFICRFHTLEYDEETKSTNEVILGETLSTYPTNYEFVNYRKRKYTMMSVKGKDNGLFWLSNLRFDCPVPENGNLQEAISRGENVLDDGTPSIYVDVVPIRTSPRFGFGNAMFPFSLVGGDFAKRKTKIEHPYKFNRTEYGFDAKLTYGDKNVLPRVEASGRWENIPVCKPIAPPPLSEEKSKAVVLTDNGKAIEKKEKRHTLSACLWASATFHTRGNDRKVTDTIDRIKEWIEYHLLVGFDHFYVYDNTGAHTNETSLKEALALFPETQVTRIDWPTICCNNNKPGDENTGERSSQYAAESSCRQRYGQYTEWIASIDTDEYLVPMGKYNNMKEVVSDAAKDDVHVLSFRSTRAYPNYETMELFYNGGECGKKENPLCLAKKDNITYIEAYNCDFSPLPKPGWSDRAKKQVYRPDYVLSHFVHYSTITHDILKTYTEFEKEGKHFEQFYFEKFTKERFTKELEQAVMVHTKTTVPGNTKGYKKTCKFGFQETWKDICRVGFPIPNNKLDVNASRPDGYKYNCYTNEKLTSTFIPKLREAMKKRLGQ